MPPYCLAGCSRVDPATKGSRKRTSAPKAKGTPGPSGKSDIGGTITATSRIATGITISGEGTDKVLREVYPTLALGLQNGNPVQRENNENKLCRAFVDTGPCRVRPTCIRTKSQRPRLPPRPCQPRQNQKGCLIVKHKGTVGRRLIFTALIGVPIAPGANYDLVDSVNYKPEKVAYKGKELQVVEKQGVHVIVLEKNYKPESLDEARKSCQLTFPSAPASAPAPPAPAPNPGSQAVLDFWSRPTGADIFVDGGYVGKTPYSLVVTPGQHTISLRKKDCGTWQRTMLVEAGNQQSGRKPGTRIAYAAVRARLGEVDIGIGSQPVVLQNSA